MGEQYVWRFWPYGVYAYRTLCRDDEWEADVATCRPSLPRGLCGVQGVWGGGVRSAMVYAVVQEDQDGNQPVCVLCTRPGPWLQPPRLPQPSLSIVVGGGAGRMATCVIRTCAIFSTRSVP